MTFENPIAPTPLDLVSNIQAAILTTIQEAFMDRPFDLVRICHGPPAWDQTNMLAIHIARYYHAGPMGLPKTRTHDKAAIPACELVVTLVRPIQNLDNDGYFPTDVEVTRDGAALTDDGHRLQRVLLRASFDGTLYPGVTPARFLFKELRPIVNGDAGSWECHFDLMLT